MEGKFEKYDLVIADELGYISFDRWEEIFTDAVMTAAMTDRLTHKSYLLNMNGSSYRLKETKEWLEKQEKEEKDELN
jgi:DNA replication protein DnaC